MNLAEIITSIYFWQISNVCISIFVLIGLFSIHRQNLQIAKNINLILEYNMHQSLSVSRTNKILSGSNEAPLVLTDFGELNSKKRYKHN